MPKEQTGERLLPLPVVIDRTSYGRSWIYDAARRGAFPSPIRIGPNKVAWLESEIEGWIAAKIAEAA